MTTVDPAQAQRIFARDIAPDLFAGVTTSPSPRLFLLGGQPGAGKSRAAETLLARYPGGDVVAIVGDDFRRHHPDYAAVLRDNPTAMPDVTKDAAATWTRLAVEHGLDLGADLLIEGTWCNPAVPLRTLKNARDLGYRTHAAVVAVPPAVSLTATLTRFYDAPAAHARWTPVAAHQDTVAALPDSVAALAASHLVDDFAILTRNGTVELDEPATDLPERATRATALFTRLTDRDLTDTEIANITTDITRLSTLNAARTPAANESWMRLAQTLERDPGAQPALDAIRTHFQPAPTRNLTPRTGQ